MAAIVDAPSALLSTNCPGESPTLRSPSLLLPCRLRRRVSPTQPGALDGRVRITEGTYPTIPLFTGLSGNT